jgi:hypothetical protein
MYKNNWNDLKWKTHECNNGDSQSTTIQPSRVEDHRPTPKRAKDDPNECEEPTDALTQSFMNTEHKYITIQNRKENT